MINTILLVITIIIIADYILGQILSFLNKKHRGNILPSELADIYTEDEYLKANEYMDKNYSLGIWTSLLSICLTLLMFLLGGFKMLDLICRSITSNETLIILLFFGIIFFTSDFISLPFDFYSTFVIEEKYGFNKTTLKTFIFDKIKTWLLAVIVGGLLLFLFILFYHKTGHYFWIYVWIAFSLFSVFMSMFYSNLIVPLFNKQKPLSEGELRNAIEQLAQKAGFALKNIYVIDGSKRSTKANAYFTGLGSKKRIVLFDTLLEQMTTEEILAVLSHEIGHYMHKHTTIGMIIGILNTGLTLCILSLFIDSPALINALGVKPPAMHIGMIAFGILYSPLSMLIGLLFNYISRKNEYQADMFAGNLGLANSLISGLKKLTTKNYSNINPHPAYVFFHYSHPTLLQRIKALQVLNLDKK